MSLIYQLFHRNFLTFILIKIQSVIYLSIVSNNDTGNIIQEYITKGTPTMFQVVFLDLHVLMLLKNDKTGNKLVTINFGIVQRSKYSSF
jgi:hypothetical protein